MSNDFHVYNDWHTPREPRDNTSRMVRWVMKKLRLEDEMAANKVLVIFSISIFLLSLYFFFIF